MFPFHAECLRCSNALVLRDIVCVLTILIMGACSCFHDMACVIRQARKSPLSHPKSIVKALATRLILKRVTIAQNSQSGGSTSCTHFKV